MAMMAMIGYAPALMGMPLEERLKSIALGDLSKALGAIAYEKQQVEDAIEAELAIETQQALGDWS